MALGGISFITVLYINIGRSIYRQSNFRKRFRSSGAVSGFAKSDKPKQEHSVQDSGVVSDGNNRTEDVFGDANHKEVSEEVNDSGVSGNRKYSKDSVYSEDESVVKTKGKRKDERRESEDELEVSRRRRRSSVFRGKGLGFKASIRRYKYSVLFMIITLVFVVSYTPRMVLMILEAVNIDFWNNLPNEYIRLCLFFYRFYIINNITNPFLYAAFDVRFRTEIKKLVCNAK